MKWANFLYFYQPVNQQKDILEAVVNQCYRPLFKGFLANPRAILTINVSGGLLEALERNGFGDVIDTIKRLYETGRVEFTSTACYHALLPLIPKDEIKRQIILNNEMLRHYLGSDYEAFGFFPPEMAYSSVLGGIVDDMEFEYMILDEISDGSRLSPNNISNGVIPSGTRNLLSAECLRGQGILHYVQNDKEAQGGTEILFRQRTSSNLIMGGIERNSIHLHEIFNRYQQLPYLITAMDGETFGHHRPGLEKVLLDVFNDPEIEFIRLSDLLKTPGERSVKVGLRDSTWASSEEDIAKGIQFISWKDPQNEIHKWQWEPINLMLDKVSYMNAKDGNYQEIRRAADVALASDQFFEYHLKNDIYDAINAVDLLRIEIGNEEVERMLDKYTARFKKIRGGQPEQRSN